MRLRHVGTVIFAGLSWSCSSVQDPGGGADGPLDFTLAPTTAWSGADVTLRSAALVGRTALPTILAGTDTLAAARVDDSTVTVTLPHRPTGALALRLVLDGRETTLPTVQVVGYREKRALGGTTGSLTVDYTTGRPVLLGMDFESMQGSATGRHLRALDLRSGQPTALPNRAVPSNEWYGLGYTMTPGEYLVRDSLGHVLRWKPLPTETVAETLLTTTDPLRQLVRLPNHWLTTSAHLLTTSETPQTGVPIASEQVESAMDFAVSPRGDRVAVAASAARNGIPVIDAATGQVAFRVPSVSRGTGVAFSADGAALYLPGGSVGGMTVANPHLVAVNATSGATLHDVPLPYQPAGVAYDAATHRVYVAANVLSAAGAPRPALLVYDAQLAPLATLVGPEDDEWDTSSFYYAVAVDTASHAAHVVAARGTATNVWSFDLKP